MPRGVTARSLSGKIASVLISSNKKAVEIIMTMGNVVGSFYEFLWY